MPKQTTSPRSASRWTRAGDPAHRPISGRREPACKPRTRAAFCRTSSSGRPITSTSLPCLPSSHQTRHPGRSHPPFTMNFAGLHSPHLTLTKRLPTSTRPPDLSRLAPPCHPQTMPSHDATRQTITRIPETQSNQSLPGSFRRLAHAKFKTGNPIAC